VDGLGEVKAELRSHDARLTANHDSIGRLRERTAAHDTAIKVIMGEVKETREDVTEMSGKLSGTSKAFYAASVAMGGMMLSICGLIAVLLSNNA